MTIFKIDIISDTVCPWCFIASKKLAAARSLYSTLHAERSDTFVVNWHPYQLNPQFPLHQSVDKEGYYKAKYGAVRTAQIHERLLATGKEAGINFRFGGMTGNSRDSHRLLTLAKQKGDSVQQTLMNELFSGVFEHEKDISNDDFLVEAATRAGLDRAEATEWLRTDQAGEEVDREVQNVREAGVMSVPTITIQGKYRLPGALEPDGWLELWERIRDEEHQPS